jgi:hypothetical protein
MTTRPPRLAEWLLLRLLPRERQSDAIRGDLLEEYRRDDGAACLSIAARRGDEDLAGGSGR